MRLICVLLLFMLTACNSHTTNTITFPNRAYQYGVYGSVQVSYDVTDQGRVENIVVSGDNHGAFSKQVIKDMKHWRFDKGNAQCNQTLVISFLPNKHRVNFRE